MCGCLNVTSLTLSTPKISVPQGPGHCQGCSSPTWLVRECWQHGTQPPVITERSIGKHGSRHLKCGTALALIKQFLLRKLLHVLVTDLGGDDINNNACIASYMDYLWVIIECIDLFSYQLISKRQLINANRWEHFRSQGPVIMANLNSQDIYCKVSSGSTF